MTGFLASVQDGDEARCVLAAGADIVDVKDPGAGALGAVSPMGIRAVVAEVGGRVPVSATIGDLPLAPGLLLHAVESTAATGVDYVKVGVFGGSLPADCREVLARCSGGGVRIVLVYFAEEWRGADYADLARAGVAGIMLDTRRKTGESLVDLLPEKVLAGFVTQARGTGMLAGLAGSLREQDVHTLVSLGPDYLGFRGALCGAGGRSGTLEAEAVCRVAAAIHGQARDGAGSRIALAAAGH